MSGTSGQPRHMPQLDSLRALAVFVVMIEHFIRVDDPVKRALPWGALGVRLFFVLSGFLITGILMRCRDGIERHGAPLGRELRNFFARRFLRLMPVYYLYLAATALMLPRARPHLWAFLVYGQNFLFAARPDVFQAFLAHFWSLAVEEQFYFTWPFIVLLVPRSRLAHVLLGIVALGPVLRAIGLLLGMGPQPIDMMMTSHLDTLGLGGLFAVLSMGQSRERAWSARLVRAGLRLGLPVSAGAVFAWRLGVVPVAVIFSELGSGLLFVWLVARAARGFGGVTGSVLNASALRYVGKVSYGIYVYHFNVPGLLREKLLPHLGLSLPGSQWVAFPILVATTIVIAAASWEILERPINRLKRHFEYRTAPALTPA